MSNEEEKLTLKEVDISLLQVPIQTMDEIYTMFLQAIKGNTISVETIVLLSTSLMQIVEKYPSLPGNQKKALVIHLLRRAVNEHVPLEKRSTVVLFINTFLPSVIDTIVSVDRKDISVAIKKGFKSCFSC